MYVRVTLQLASTLHLWALAQAMLFLGGSKGRREKISILGLATIDLGLVRCPVPGSGTVSLDDGS